MWKSVIGYPGYEISDEGKVMSYLSGEPVELSIFKNKSGYSRVGLMKDGKQKQVFVHRLVACSFIGEIPKGFSVNHIDGDKTNNDLSNLEIVTHKENCIHSFYELKNGIKPVLKIDFDKLEIITEYESIAKAVEDTKIDGGTITRCCKGERNAAGGYLWCYKGNFNKDILEKQKDVHLNKRYEMRKPVLQINTENDEIIKEFPGVREAKRMTGITTISHCLTGRTKVAGGYHWRFK